MVFLYLFKFEQCWWQEVVFIWWWQVKYSINIKCNERYILKHKILYNVFWTCMEYDFVILIVNDGYVSDSLSWIIANWKQDHGSKCVLERYWELIL